MEITPTPLSDALKKPFAALKTGHWEMGLVLNV